MKKIEKVIETPNSYFDADYLKETVFNSVDDDDTDDDSNQPKKPTSSQSSNTPVLDTYSRDLTRMSEEGKLDPIVGRIKEIERVSQVLSRRKKNSPILIGEPGCVDGRTMIDIRKISDHGSHKLIIEY